MDYAEFWVLESAIEMGAPFSRLVGPPDKVAAFWNKAYHHLPRAEMLKLLERLARDGDIVASEECVQERFSPTRQQIDAWLGYDSPRRIKQWYWLTPQGGERWERFAQANWDRYHSYEWDWGEEDFLEIAATTPKISERAYQYSVPWNSLHVFPETVVRRTLHPWAATYWKILPVGHGVRFKCIDTKEDDEAEWIIPLLASRSPMEIGDFRARLKLEYDYFHNWYTQHPATPQVRDS